MAAGVGLLPGIAQAAPAAPGGPGAAQPDLGPLEAGGPESESVRSSADRTVVTPLAGAGSRAAGAQGKLSAASPAIALEASSATAHQMDLSVLVTSEDAELDITVDWGDGTKTEGKGAARQGSERWDFSHGYALGSYMIKVTVKDTTHGVQAVNELKYVTRGTEFTPHAPTRLLDTRAGVGAKQAKVAGRSSVALKVAGAADVPAGVRAVVLNVTVTNTRGPGHVSVQSDKGLAETVQTSNVNYLAGQSVPNLVIANVGADGFVHLFNGGWESVDLLADVTGYFTASEAGGYTALNPTRVLDTRERIGGRIPEYGTVDVAIAGTGRVPKGATAVALNLTVTNPWQSGHLTAYPAGQPVPATSSVNFAPEQTVANSVIVPVGADGKITIRNGSWMSTDVVVDVVGYYGADSQAAYVPAWVPYRAMDTRKDKWWADKKSGPVPARSYLPVYLPHDEDLAPVVGWVLNATVTNTTEVGFLSVAADHNQWSDYKAGTATMPERPVSSALNWTAGATVPNLVQTTIGQGMHVDLWNQGWKSVDMIVDVQGKYQVG
ncbi:hypothetical protein OG898_28330 [Streptomyces sp. NBC_00193]|uniref:hypothetical protein n=1 Tax=unclassified Streptomyces TaxID=2593676 RepID=UPI002250CBB3|nr:MULTISPECIES: hypothetical protein [unclassified Streptomyces]MCX5129983.1 hypothetical protein [Streptomyces sp. NBC_00347]MCX5300342.1 hypothetical protein [Streptomyces sp. NBC_00193]